MKLASLLRACMLFLLICIRSESVNAQIINGNSPLKKIYIANDDHTDYMWSGDEAAYKKAFLDMLDYYIRLNDSTIGLPYSLQSKWNCDGSFWVYTYRQNRSKEQFDKLISQIRRGQITVPLNTLVVLMGAAPAEATIRNMFYAGSLERKYGLELPLVLNMEDQVLPLGLSSLWAGSGARYSWKGVCACATKVTGLDSRAHQMYWYKGLDDQKILMKWYDVNPALIRKTKDDRYFLGTYLEATQPAKAVEDCKTLMADTADYPYSIAGAFGKGGDDLTTLTDLFVTTAAAAKHPDCQVIVSNETDFFKDFEKTYGASLPSETVSYGSTEWGNSYASLAEVSASVKRSIEKLRTAEAVYTFVALKDSLFAADLKQEKENAWIACGLYFEHNWTADGPHITRKQRADWERRMAADIEKYVDTLYERSFKSLGQLIEPSHSGAKSYIGSFYVFNSLSWARTDYSDYPYDGTHDIRILDKSDFKPAPFQFIRKKEKPYIRILASNVPSLGYKVYQILKNEGGNTLSTINPAAGLLSVTDSTLENRFYKISYTSRGVLTRLFDKLNNRECIRPFSNRYGNDLGGGPANDRDSIYIESMGPVSATLKAFSYQPVKHTTRLTLFTNSDRIEIENYIQQNTGENPVTYSFCFNLNHPDTWHEEAGAILHARSASRGGHYADSASRLDWLALNHFVDMSDLNYGMILSNRDAYFMKIGESKYNSLDDTSAHIQVLATGRIDPYLGIENQDGDTYFEDFLALRAHGGGFRPADAMRFSLQHQNPLIAAPVGDKRINGTRLRGEDTHKINSSEKSFYSGTQFSLLSLSDSGVMVWAIKPSEEGIGNGMIVRLWNFTGENAPVTIFPTPVLTKAFTTTHIETNDQPVEISGAKLHTVIGHNRMQTFRLFVRLRNFSTTSVK